MIETGESKGYCMQSIVRAVVCLSAAGQPNGKHVYLRCLLVCGHAVLYSLGRK